MTASRVTPLRDADPELIRSPPYNSEAEQALLGALLINNAAYPRVSEFLQSEHFGNAVHARIYAAIGKLVERGQIANPVTLKNLFDQDSALGETGGTQYLVRLAAAAVTIINAEDYGRAIHDLYLRRQLIALGEDVVNDAFRHDLDDRALEQIERAERKLFDLATAGQAEGGFRDFGAALTSAITIAEFSVQEERQDCRRRNRVYRPRQKTRRAASVRPGHPRRAAIDGKDRAGDQHRLQRRPRL